MHDFMPDDCGQSGLVARHGEDPRVHRDFSTGQGECVLGAIVLDDAHIPPELFCVLAVLGVFGRFDDASRDPPDRLDFIAIVGLHPFYLASQRQVLHLTEARVGPVEGLAVPFRTSGVRGQDGDPGAREDLKPVVCLLEFLVSSGVNGLRIALRRRGPSPE